MNLHSRVSLALFLIALPFFAFSQTCSNPYPQHSVYSAGTIIPNHLPQRLLDDSVLSFYTQWRKRYVKRSLCDSSYYIWGENTGKGHECVSEGQGYGMMITVLMARKGSDEQEIFNGLFRYYKDHPSKRSPYLMSWMQGGACDVKQRTSASDGDIDIAYSLLLASKQWGNEGKINYLAEAQKIIQAMREQEVNKNSYSILLSNGVEHDSPDYYDMRSSDFIPSAFKAFSKVDSFTFWNKVVDKNYKLLTGLQREYSPDAGLIPDFITGINHHPKPVKPHYLESKYDGSFSYNACRVPWRIALDGILYGDKRSKTFLNPLNKWIRETTSNNPDNISAGYTLAGDDIKGRNFEALSFICSFAASAMVDAKNQPWLNSLWDYIIHFKLGAFDYYDNSLKMLNLILLSGNYWSTQ